ncbi:MAG: hypothetical protein PVS2B2_21760 [Candidatus Acidiferrum sp.]
MGACLDTFGGVRRANKGVSAGELQEKAGWATEAPRHREGGANERVAWRRGIARNMEHDSRQVTMLSIDY